MNAVSKQAPSAEWIAELRQRYPTERYIDRALTRKMQHRADPPYCPQTEVTVLKQLNDFLKNRTAKPIIISDVRALAGGGSKEQFSFVLKEQGQDQENKVRQMVLRMQPAESTVETHRLREFQVLNCVQKTLPVPETYWVDDEGLEFCQPALIYELCPGVNRMPGSGLVSLEFNGSFSPQLRPYIKAQFIDYLAKMATFDFSQSDMSAFDVPLVNSTQGVTRAINCWDRVWHEDSVESNPLITLAAHWLRENAPPLDHCSIVHGDYRQGNFLFDPETGRITAILDWELAFLGDRHHDLAWLLMPMFVEKNEAGEDLVAGLCSREEFLSEYEQRCRMPIDGNKLAYYEIFCFWTAFIMAHGTSQRCVLGQKTHHDIVVSGNSMAVDFLLPTLATALSKRMQA